jgi:hypothetical protein
LRVVAWGPLYAKDVLLQILQRTKRAGHPGSAEWIVYKYGGHVGLSDHRLLSMYPNYMKTMEDIPPKTATPYEYSLIEELHARQFEQTTSRRLQILYEDTIRDYLTDSLRDEIEKYVVIKEDNRVSIDDHILFTPAYIEKFLKKHSSLIQSVAHAESRLKSIPDMVSELTNIGKNLSPIRALASSLVQHQLTSSLAKDLVNIKGDAVGFQNESPSERKKRIIPVWEQIYTDLQKTGHSIVTLSIPKKISSLLSLSEEVNQLGELQRVNISGFLKSEEIEHIVLSDLPNVLVTVKRTVISSASKDSKTIPLVHEFSYRLTTMNSATKSIDDDITISYKSRIQKNGKINMKHDQAYLKQYVELLMKSLVEKATNEESMKASIKELRRILTKEKLTKFKGKQDL